MKDRALSTINIVVWVFMVSAAVLSTSHIVETGIRLGLDWEAYTLPIFVDGIAIVGKVSMLPRFTRAFRRSGFRLLMLGGSLSLGANVYAGHNLGQKLFGVLIVAGFMALESHATKASRTEALAEKPRRKMDPEKAAAANAKRQATREANRLANLTPAERRAATRKRNRAADYEIIQEAERILAE